jgi:hypothetical protein
VVARAALILLATPAATVEDTPATAAAEVATVLTMVHGIMAAAALVAIQEMELITSEDI